MLKSTRSNPFFYSLRLYPARVVGFFVVPRMQLGANSPLPTPFPSLHHIHYVILFPFRFWLRPKYRLFVRN